MRLQLKNLFNFLNPDYNFFLIIVFYSNILYLNTIKMNILKENLICTFIIFEHKYIIVGRVIGV